MRILQVIDSLKYGGAQKLMVTFAEEAAAHNVEVVFACLSNSDSMPLASKIQDNGALVVNFPARRLFSPGRLIAFYRFVRQGKFSVIHSHLTYANILAYLIGWICSVPVISSLHSTAQDKRHSNFLRDNIEFWALKNACRVMAVGQSVMQAYKFLGRNVFILPNAVEKGKVLSSEERDTIRKKLTGDATRPILISAGRLSPDKCFHDLLEGFALVHQQDTRVALVIAGDGVLRNALEARTADLGLEGNVFWLGMRDDIPSLLAASDIYVSMSQREGMPVAVLEGMAAGLPLVVTPVGDTPFIIRESEGILVSVHQSQEFAQAVLSLLADSNRRSLLGLSARTRAQSEYGAAKWFETLMNIYQSVTN